MATVDRLPGCYLLVVLGEPLCEDHKGRIIQKVAKGLLSWDSSITDCDLQHMEQVCQQMQKSSIDSELLIQHSTEKLAVEVLLNPQVFTLKQCLKNLLVSPTGHKHLIYAGYSFTGTGSWMLQDGILKFQDFIELFKDEDVSSFFGGCSVGSVSMHIHAPSVGGWTSANLEKTVPSSLKIELNPEDSPSGVQGAASLLDFLDEVLTSNTTEKEMVSTPVVGNIRFNKPTLYVFPSGQGDCSLFGVTGFTMLIDGGFTPLPCFWNFVRHLERLDSIMVTRLNESNLWGVSSLFKKKVLKPTYPHIGYVFCNIGEGRPENGESVSVSSKDKSDLMVSVIDIGQEFLGNLKTVGLSPHQCIRESCLSPLTLYHKVGHGTLEMFILSPPRDSKVLKDFLKNWSSSKDSFAFVKTDSASDNGGQVAIPITNVMSICCLLIWRPAEAHENITRILFPGSAPQSKIFEGLEKIKHLDVLRSPQCSGASLKATSAPSSATSSATERQSKARVPSSESKVTSRLRSVSPSLRKPKPTRSSEADAKGDTMGSIKESPIHKRFQSVQRTPTVSNVKETVQVKSAPLHSRITKRSASKVDTKKPISGSADSKKVRAPPKSPVSDADYKDEKVNMKDDEVNLSEAVAVGARKESIASVSSHKEESSLDSKVVDEIDALTLQNKQLLVNDHNLESESEAQAQSCVLEDAIMEECKDLTARKMSDVTAHPDAVATDIDTAALPVEQPITLDAPPQTDLGHELKSTLSGSEELVQQMAEEEDEVVVSEISAEQTDVQTEPDSVAAELETAELEVDQSTVLSQSLSTDLHHELKSVLIDGSEELVKIDVDEAEIVPEIQDSETDIQETASANSKRSSLASSASLKDSTLVEALHEGSDLSFKTTEGDGPDFQQATPGDLDLVEPVSDIVESKLMPSLLNEEINGDRPMEEDLSRVMNSDTVPVSSTPVDVPISSRDEANSGNVSDSENLSDSEMISSVITELDKKTGIDLTDGRRESTSSIPLFTEKDLVSSITVEVDVDTLEAEVEQLLIESPGLDSEAVAVNVEDTIQVNVISNREKNIHEVVKQRDDFADNRSASTETTVSKHDVSENDEGIPTIENKDPVESEAKVIHEVRGTEKEVVEKVSQTTATQLQHGAESDANAEDELDNLNTQANDDVQEDSGQTTESTELTQISDKNHSADVGSKEPVIAKKEALDETVSDYTESEDASEPSQEKIVQPEVNLTGLQLDDAGKQLQKGSSDMSVDSANGVSGSADNRSSEKRDSLSSRKVSIVDSIKTIGDDAIAMINSFVASNDVDTDETMRLEADQVNSNEAEAVNVEKEESPLSSKTVEDVHVKPVFVNAEEVDVKPMSPVQATDSPDKISEEEKHSTASEISVSLAHRDSVAAATDVAELLIEPSTAFGKSSKTNELKSNVNDSAVEFGKQGILETAGGAVSDEDDKDETFGRKLDEMNLNETVTEDVSKELIAPVSPHEEGSSLDSKMDDDDTVAVQDKLLPMKDHSMESKPVDINLSVEKRDSLSMKNTSLVDSVKSIGDDEMAITKSFVASSDAAPEKEKSLEADEVSFSEAVAVDGWKESTASVSSHKDSKIVDDDIDALTVQNKQLLVNDPSLESEFEAQAQSHDLQMEMIEEHEDLTARKMSAALAHPDAVATDIDTAALSVEQAITLEAPLQKDLGHELKSTLSVSDELAQQMTVEEKDKVVVSEVSADETDVQTKADSFAAEIETADLAVEQLTVSDQSPSTDLRHELKSVPIDGSEEIVKLGVDKAEIVPEIPDSETDIQETASANSKRSSLASSASLKDTTLVESLHEESDLAFKITEGDGASEDFQPTIPRDLNLEPVSEIVESKLMPSLLNEKIDGDRPMEEDLLRVTNSDAASVSSTPVDVLISSRDEANSANVSGSDKVPDSEMKGNVITDPDKKTGVDITDESRESTSSIQEQNEKYPMSSTTVDGDALVAEIEPVLIQVESPDLDPETVLVNNEDTTGINSPAKKVHEVGKQKDEFDDNRSASTETTVSKHDVDEKDEDIPTIEIEEPMKSEGKINCPVEETTEKDFEGAEDEVVEKVSQIMTTQLQHGAENDSNAEDAPENVKASVASHARANDNVQEDISRTTESTELTQISDTNHAADVGSKEPVNAVKEALDETVSDNTEKDVSESSEEKIEQPEVKLTGLQLDDAGKQLQKGSSDMSVDSADGVSGSADNRSSSEKRDSLSSRKVSIVDSMKTIGDDAVAMVKSFVASNDADSDEMLSIKAGEVNFDEGVSEVVAVDARKESIASVSSHKEDSSLDPKTAAEIDVLTVPDKPLLVPDHSLESKPETQAPSHGLQEEIIEECKDLTARKMSAALAHPDVVAIDIDTSALPVEKLIALDASPKTDLVNELKPILSLPEQLAQLVAEEEVMSEMSVKQTDVQNKADSVANELEKADLAVEQSTALDEFLSTDLGHELKPVLIDGSEELVKLDVDEADIASEIHVKETDILKAASTMPERSSLASLTSLKDSTLVEALHEESDPSLEIAAGSGVSGDFQLSIPRDSNPVEPVSDLVESKLISSLHNEKIDGDRPMEEDLQRVINSDAVPVSSTPVDVLILSRDEANSGNVSGSENVPDSEMTSSVIADLEKKTEIDLTDGRRESISSLPSHNEKYPVSSTTVEVNSVTLEAETEPLLRESDELDPETVAVLDGDTIQVVVIDDKEKEIHEVLKQKDDFAGNSVETTVVKHDVEEKDENIAIIEMKDIVKSEAKVIQEVEDTTEKDFGSAEVVENISEITAIQFQSVTESDANAGDELENLNVLVASHTRADDDVQEKSGRKTESTELTQSSDRNDALDIVSKEPVIAKKDASEENVSEETETRKSSQEKIAQPEITLTGLELDDAKKQLQRGSADISVDSADGISGVVDDRFSSEKRDSLSSRKASVGDSMKAIGDGAMAMIKSFVTVSDDKDATLSTKVDEVNLDEMIPVDGRKESIASVSSRKEESLNSTIDDDVDAVAVQDKQLLVKDHSLESKPVDSHFAVEKRDSLSSKNTSLVHSVKSISDDAMAMMKSFVASSDAAHENETLSLEADQVNFDEAVSVDSRKESIASVSSHKDDASLNSAAMIKPFVASSDAADENVTLSMKAEEANSNEGDAVDGREEESPLKSKTPDVQVKPSLINEDKVDAKPKASTRSPDSPDQISEKGEDSAASETSAALAHRDSVATVKDAAELPMEQSAALGQSSRTDLGNELKSIPNDAVEFVKQGVEAATGSERSVKQTGLPAALSETSEMPSAVTLPSPKDSTPMVEALENVRSSKIIAGREMSDAHRPSITQDLNLVEPVSLMVESELTGPVLNEKLVSDQVEKDHSEIMNTEIVEGSSISADISIASRNDAPSIVSGSESVLDNETSCITVVDQDNKSGINPTKFSLESSETLSAEQESRKESLTLDADEDSKKPILVGHRRESSTTAFTEQPVESIIEKLQEQGPDVIFAAGEVGIDESTEIAADPLSVDRKNSEGSEPLAMTASALQSTTAGPVSPIGQAVEPKGGSSISTPSMKQPIEEIVEEELTSEAKVVLEESLEQSDSGTVLLRTEKVDESTIVKTIAATPISVTTTCTSTDISTTRSTEVISQNVDDKPKLEDWGKPLGLPNPPEPGDGPSSRRTASKSRTTTRPTASRVDIKPTAGGVKLGPKPTKSTSSTSETKDSPPVYMDLAYVPHHGDLHYCNGDFFKRIQARYYVFSGVNPSREVFNALIEGKKTWEDQTAQVTVIPTHETDTLGFWMSENQDTLEQLHIDVAPPANRCTVTLQDHETSCSAYRLEF